MGTATTRLRRVGVGGVAAAVALGALATANTAFAAPADFAAATTPNVTQGAASQKAGDLTAEFANTFTTNAAESFTVGSNLCDTQANIDKAISIAGTPTVALSGPFNGTDPGDKTSTKPTYTVALSSSSPACATVGVKDVITVTLTKPAVGVGTDTFKVTVSNLAYNLGPTAPLGAVTVTAAGDFGLVTTTANNATVVNKTYTFIPVIAAQTGSTGNVLGTARFSESTAGAYFGTGDTNVVLTVSAGQFSAGVTPKVTVPAGYTVKSAPATTASPTYTLVITGPATLSKADVSVSGLKFDTLGATGTVTMSAAVGGGTAVALPAVNVLNFAARTGGSDRYSTAAALFNDEFGSNDNAVLASGADFPDALSANYLAGRLGTGTLLTTPKSLPSVTRQALIRNDVKTVYILGGTGAVSAAVASEIAGMHVSNNPNNAFISVVRLGGADRYATNKAVNERDFQSSNTVLLASGAGFADALALGPIAYSNEYPLILTGGAKLGASELSQLSDFAPTNVVIAGGTGVVSQGIEDALRASGYTVLRLAGADRTLTAAQVATWATVGVGDKTGLSAGPDWMFDSNTVYITNGLSFADALSAGPVAGDNYAAIVATAGVSSLGQGIPGYLGTKTVGSSWNGKTVNTLHALGLTGAVSSSVMKAAAASIGQ